jgi:hypothetical protein
MYFQGYDTYAIIAIIVLAVVIAFIRRRNEGHVNQEDTFTFQHTTHIFHVPSNALVDMETNYADLYKKADTFEDIIDILDAFFEEEDPLLYARVVRKGAVLAIDTEDLDRLFGYVREETVLHRELFLRHLEITTSLSDTERIWSEWGLESEYGKLAVLRAAELIQRGDSDEESE